MQQLDLARLHARDVYAKPVLVGDLCRSLKLQDSDIARINRDVPELVYGERSFLEARVELVELG